MTDKLDGLTCPTCGNNDSLVRYDVGTYPCATCGGKPKSLTKFIEKYDQATLDQVLEILLDDNGVANRNNNYESCTDDLCDDEGCRMYKAFKLYLKYR